MGPFLQASRFLRKPGFAELAEMAVGQCNGANRYIKGVNLGEGTYGVVFKAVDKVVIFSISSAFLS